MTDIVIRPRADEKYDIYVMDSDNGNALLNSSQGYERAIDAEDQVRKLFSASEKLARIRDVVELGIREKIHGAKTREDIMAILDEPTTPIRLTVEYRDGRVKSEVLR